MRQILAAHMPGVLVRSQVGKIWRFKEVIVFNRGLDRVDRSRLRDGTRHGLAVAHALAPGNSTGGFAGRTHDQFASARSRHLLSSSAVGESVGVAPGQRDDSHSCGRGVVHRPRLPGPAHELEAAAPECRWSTGPRLEFARRSQHRSRRSKHFQSGCRSEGELKS